MLFSGSSATIADHERRDPPRARYPDLCPEHCPENLQICPAPPTGCSYGEAPKNKCGCQTACPPVDCLSKTKTMTNLVANIDDYDDDDYDDDESG